MTLYEIAPIVSSGDIICENITIKDVLYVEGLGHNLFSIGIFFDKDLNVNFNKDKCVVRNHLLLFV